MKLIIQPIFLSREGPFEGFPYLRSVLEALFRFDNQATIIKIPITYVPSSLFDISRNQYMSNRLLSWLQQIIQPPEDTKVLAVCDFDAYFGKFNFCFGQAVISGNVSAIYLARLVPLRGDSYEELLNLFQDRIVKEAVHEIGHTHGLRHCSNDGCVMFKSKTILDTDKKSKEFCDSCSNLLTVASE